MQQNMLTPDDKKFILMAINDGLVQLAGTTADLIEGVSSEVRELRKDVNELKVDVSVLKEDVSILKKDVKTIKVDLSFLKQQAIHTNKGLGLIRDDLGLAKLRT